MKELSLELSLDNLYDFEAFACLLKNFKLSTEREKVDWFGFKNIKMDISNQINLSITRVIKVRNILSLCGYLCGFTGLREQLIPVRKDKFRGLCAVLYTKMRKKPYFGWSWLQERRYSISSMRPFSLLNYCQQCDISTPPTKQRVLINTTIFFYMCTIMKTIDINTITLEIAHNTPPQTNFRKASWSKKDKKQYMINRLKSSQRISKRQKIKNGEELKDLEKKHWTWHFMECGKWTSDEWGT